MILAMAACTDKNADNKTSEEEVVNVKTAVVEEQEVSDLQVLTASIEADKVNNISSAQPNRIKEILVDEGMKVGKGQKLVVMDDINTETYQLQVDNAKAALSNAQLTYNRALELFKIGGGTKQNVDQAELQLINSKNSLASAERTLRNARENTVLTAPVSGVVTARNYDPGDMTGQLPILTISTIAPVKAVINVSESLFSKVKNGMPALLTLDPYPGEEFHGKVTMIAPAVDPNSRTFGVEVTSANTDGRILPGMFGRVTLNLGRANHAVVPDKAVEKQRGSGDHYVYIVNPDKTLSYVKVELGQRLGNTYEIISGVEPGQTVVVSEKSRLKKGMKVNILK